MSEAPERIWLTGFVKDQYGARLGRGTISDLDHSPNPNYPEYVRANRIEELNNHCRDLEAKLAKAVEALKSLHRRQDTLDTFDAVVDEIVSTTLAELKGQDDE